MKVSLGAGLLFLAVLAAVFVPTALRYDQPPNPVALLARDPSDPFVVFVQQVNVEKALGEYKGELNVTGVGQGPINVSMNPLAVGGWPAPPDEIIIFADSDGDGALSEGDTFTIRPRTNYATYRILIFHASTFVNPEAPCPCAAARIEFSA